MRHLTEHFTLEELVFSEYATRHGIDNRPTQSAVENLKVLAEGLEKVRDILSAPMIVSSGYRSARLNQAIGGSPSSAHTDGLAADFISPKYGSPKAVAQSIARSDLIFDQLIHEGRWVHISFGGKNRKEILTAIFNNGDASYVKGLT